MRIICPTCSSHYDVDTDRIAAAGQLVRCAHCRGVWRVTAADAVPAAPQTASTPAARSPGIARAAEPLRDPIDFMAARARLRPTGTRPSHGTGVRTTLGLAAAAIVCLASGAATLKFHAAIASHVPASAPVFAALGLRADPTGLALRDVHSALVADGTKTVLTLQGEITNLREGPTAVPDLTVMVRGADQSPLYTWTASPPKAKLARGETIVFRSRLAAPPASGQDVRVSFAENTPPS